MSQARRPDDASRTTIDPRIAPVRLKEGLVPSRTGIFLRVERGAGAGRVFELSRGGVYLVGREGADLAIDDAKVSRKHAEIGLYGPDAWVLRDLASTNGTFVNDRRVTEKHRLANDDLIRFGDTWIRFTLLEDAVPLSR